MSIQEFAQEIYAQLCGEGGVAQGCYIAILHESEGWVLEVEVDAGTIAGCWLMEFNDRNYEGTLAEARLEADRLDSALKELGFTVYPTRATWEDSVYFTGEI